jgi:hypothetical protein
MFFVGPPSVFDSGGKLVRVLPDQLAGRGVDAPARTLPGLVRYITPSCTSGVPWLLPSRIVSTQASCSSPTLPRRTRASGLKPCPSLGAPEAQPVAGAADRCPASPPLTATKSFTSRLTEAVRTLGRAGDAAGTLTSSPTAHCARLRADLRPGGLGPLVGPSASEPDLASRVRAQLLRTRRTAPFACKHVRRDREVLGHRRANRAPPPASAGSCTRRRSATVERRPHFAMKPWTREFGEPCPVP